MKEQCIFRCQFKGHTLRVVEVDNPDGATRKCYRTYMDRRRLDVCDWYYLGGAIGSILLVLSREVLDEIKEIW